MCHTVLELVIKMCEILFWAITKEPLALLNCNTIFEFLGQFASGCLYHF